VSEELHGLRFDSVAELYERSRPGYAPGALEWLAERLPLPRVLDLAAGTGKLTRQLVALGAEVVAVEPSDAMRGVLERVVPQALALAGSAEEIPLPDASVDAVTVGQAFHWFEADPALAEMHRVLRNGGGIGLLWNEWDRKVPLLRVLDDIVETFRPKWIDRESSRALERSRLFGVHEERRFGHAERLPAEVVVDRVASVSAIAAAEPDDRRRALEQARELVGTGIVDFPMITIVVVADRV
jgi:ubiquinone/menaquinone biosynthesis C-methylase UbiE